MDRSPRQQLEELAALHGVGLGYVDTWGERQTVREETLLHVLTSLGVPIETRSDVPAALRQSRLQRWSRALPPVVVAWDGALPELTVRLPAAQADAAYRLDVELEDGSHTTHHSHFGESVIKDDADVEGRLFAELRARCDLQLPLGYHRLVLSHGDTTCESRVLAAPRHAHAPAHARCWGAFLPLYSLRSERGTGVGDFSDLAAFSEWVRQHGGAFVGMLPMLASFLDGPIFEPSPYAPVSRLFWNELFLDLERLPELEGCAAARARLGSAAFEHEAAALRQAPLVDYARLAQLRRSVLQPLADHAFEHGGELQRELKRRPELDRYARFRATMNARSETWHRWPARLREGEPEAADMDPASFRYHAYAQWRTLEQLDRVCRDARREGPGIYLDLPLGAHPDGYDAWRYRDAFMWGCSTGAPPDDFFTAGQNWGFPPLCPEALRARGYDYLIASLRNHLAHAGMLRIDHVMALHRVFCIPNQAHAKDGTYVHFRPDELYAVLCIESARHGSMVIGEDLGTVPPEVRTAMAEHDVQRMYVMQFEAQPDAAAALPAIPEQAMAGLNTHDMPTFAGFWNGADIEDRVDMGLLSATGAQRERERREALRDALCDYLRRQGWLDEQAGPEEVLHAALSHLGDSAARTLVVNLEDLWLETHPQNVPGTTTERPNWRRRARLTFRQMAERRDVIATFDHLTRLRGRLWS